MNEGVGECRSGCREGSACVGQVLPAAEDCATTDDDENCDGHARCTGAHEWSVRLGGSDTQRGKSVSIDSEGNVLVAGWFFGDAGFARSEGGADGFVAKLSPDGTMRWYKTFGGSSADDARVVVRDAEDNVIVAGTFSMTVDFNGVMLTERGTGDVFVAKYSKTGDRLWVKQIGGPDVDGVNGLAVDSENNVLIAGLFFGQIEALGETMTSVGGADIFVAKIDADGGYVWSRRIGDEGHQLASDLAVTRDDDVVLVGQTAGTVDFGTGPLTALGNDGFVAKLDKTSSTLWAKVFGDDMDQELTEVDVGVDGNILVAGNALGGINFGGSTLESAGEKDVVVAAFDSGGEHIWSNRYGNVAAQNVGGVAVDQTSHVLLTGDFGGTVDFGRISLMARGSHDVFVVKLDPAGETVWAGGFGDAMAQSAEDVAVDALGTILLTGHFSGSIGFGGEVLTSADGDDAFVAKLRP
ncbi:SBBP repeat-containing protein [Sorangium sp. So ce1099]|uniref:SBBP repeat-containing protein n=1 Tax=Sorangium sp. So ce1099 TaxID=3133331 RepID=UPI003F5E950F